MTLQDKVGKAIVQLRKARGISQETFAFEAGIDRRYMSDIENGKRNISLAVLSAASVEEKERKNLFVIRAFRNFVGEFEKIACVLI